MAFPPTINTAVDVLKYANTGTGDIFWAGIIFVIWIILASIFHKKDWKRSITSSGFVCILFSGLLWLQHFVGIDILLITIVVTAGGVLLTYLEEK